MHCFLYSRQSHVRHDTISAKYDLGTSTNWSSCGSSKKLVLCCSALTDLERVNKLLIVFDLFLLSMKSLK